MLWLQIFHRRKVIASSLQNCFSEEGLSTAPWSFFYPSLLSFLFYSLIKGEKLVKEVSIDCNGFRLCHMKTAACTCEHTYEIHPIYTVYRETLESLKFGEFSISKFWRNKVWQMIQVIKALLILIRSQLRFSVHYNKTIMALILEIYFVALYWMVLFWWFGQDSSNLSNFPFV